MSEKKKLSPVAPILFTAAAFALAADQAWLGWNAGRAEVSHLFSAPPLWLWAPVVLLVLAAGAVGVWAARVKGDPKLARVPVLTLVVVGFVEFFVTPAVRPVDMVMDSTLPIHAFAADLQARAVEAGALPSTVEELQDVVNGGESGMPTMPPPLLIRGKPLTAWSFVVRTGCSGPDVDGVGVGAGTFIYCLAPGGKRAWLTATSRLSSTFGSPEIVALHGKPVVERIELADEKQEQPSDAGAR